MAHMMALSLELLSAIMTLLATSTTGAIDWARVSATCKIFRTLAGQIEVLRVIDCQNLMLVGRCEPHHHINGLLSRCVRAGNLSAENMLAKAILRGGTPLWKMMLENDITNSSIKCATALPLSERRYIAESLKTGSIADLPYILFLLEDLPQMRELYARQHHFRLVKSFIVLADLGDIVCHNLKYFMEFFAAYLNFSETRTHDVLNWMYWYELMISQREHIQLSNDMFEGLWRWRPSYKEDILLAFNNAI